jgi:multisubunit Na+/H+ antiporter MnhG subunit
VTRELPVAILLVAGVTLMLLSCLGLVVMRTPLDRLHYTGPAAFGALLVGIAITVEESFSLIGDKALAVAAILLLAGPVVAHTTARSARIRERGEWTAGIEDHRELGQ